MLSKHEPQWSLKHSTLCANITGHLSFISEKKYSAEQEANFWSSENGGTEAVSHRMEKRDWESETPSCPVTQNQWGRPMFACVESLN